MEIWRTRRLCKDDRIYRTANERFSGFVSETVRGARDVKLLNSEDAFCAEAQERIINANDKRLAMQGRSWALKLARWELSELGSFVFIVLLALAIKYNFQSAATVIIIYNYFTSLDTRAVTLAGEFMEFVKDFNLSVERVCALVNSPEFPKEHFGSVTLNDPQGEITFEHVGFAYPSNDPLIREREILKDMSFTIRAGEMVALVGRSGCGKSTVFNLLCRLYDHQHGRILLDGQDVRTLTKDSIRNNMTVVSQNPYIFNLSVRDNLRLAKSDMTDERFDALSQKFKEAEAKKDAVVQQISDIRDRRGTMEDFLRILKQRDGEVTTFSEKLWCGLLDYATAYTDGRLTFTFKNGSTFEG